MDHKDKLKQLLEAGVITPEEYNGKVNNIEINMQLKDLLEAGVITQEEYDSKLENQKDVKKDATLNASVVNRMNRETAVTRPTIAGSESQTEFVIEKSNDSKATNISLIVLGVLLAFAIGIGVGVACSDRGYDVDEETFYEYESSYNALYDFYLDSAVLVREGDGTYYHRYGCSTFPEEYSYWCYNVETAKQKGFIPCPTCFGVDKDEYIKNNL